MPKKIIEQNLRLPDNIDRAVRRMAEDNDRSINKQITHMLRQQIPAEYLDEATIDIAAGVKS